MYFGFKATLSVWLTLLGILLIFCCSCFKYFEVFSLTNSYLIFPTFKVLNYISSIDTNLLILFLVLRVLLWGRFKKSTYFLFCILVFWGYEVPLVEHLYQYAWGYENVNLNLLNGLFLVHPLLLIFLWCFGLLYVYILFGAKVKYLFRFNFIKSFLSSSVLIFSTLLLVTGGWWAQQELNWGGWWAWDFVELVNLNLFSLSLFLRHKSSLKKYSWPVTLYSLYLALVVYFYTRYNLIPSIHSFLSNLSFLQYDYVIILGLSCLGAGITIFSFVGSLKSKFTGNRNENFYTLSTFLLIVLGLIAIILINLVFLKVFNGALLRSVQIYFYVFMFLCVLDLRVWDIFLGFFFILSPLGIILYKVVFYCLRFWQALLKLHYSFFLLLALFTMLWGVLDLVFLYKYKSLGGGSLNISLRVNRLGVVEDLGVELLNTYQIFDKITPTKMYFFQGGVEFNDFSLNYYDKYQGFTKVTRISINRVLQISYYSYYTLPLYCLIVLIFIWIVPLKAYSVTLKNVFLFDLSL